MSKVIKAYLYWLHPTDDDARSALAAVRRFAQQPRLLSFSHIDKNYEADRFVWDDQRQILTGAVFLERDRALPELLDGKSAKPLNMKAGESLGEVMCFAYWPSPGAALVHFNSRGPRHSVMPSLVASMGYGQPMRIAEVLDTQAMLAVRDASRIKRLSFKVTTPEGINGLGEIDGSVADALKVAGRFEGMRVAVTISMAEDRREGLALGVVKSVCERLFDFHDTRDRGRDIVNSCKVDGETKAGRLLKALDILKAREPVKLTFAERSCHLDTMDGTAKLAEALHSRKSMLRAQLSTNP